MKKTMIFVLAEENGEFRRLIFSPYFVIEQRESAKGRWGKNDEILPPPRGKFSVGAHVTNNELVYIKFGCNTI